MGFLEEIVRETRRELDQPGFDMGVGPTPGPSVVSRSLRDAILHDRERGALIVEYKRVSPGQASPTLPPRTIGEFLAQTRSAAPTAYSCLATRPRFHGSPGDVREIARSTDRPVLFKDFVIDRRQVELAARTGASAVLLIARLEGAGYLSEPLASLAQHAHRLGLEVVLEFHARTELSHGAGVTADVYGVNARDLDTLSIDPTTAEATLAEAGRRRLRPLLGLSGVETAADAQRFWQAGADGILVGTAVARSADPARFLTTLRRPPTEGSR